MSLRPTIIWRAAAFLALWLILVGGADPADRPAGIVAIVSATWASLRLMPPGGTRLSLTALTGLLLRFLRQSVVAGVDVAWCALDPRLPLQPGLVAYPTCLPPGPALNAFCALASLAPGTLPAGSNEGGEIVIHCLDVGQPVRSALAADERLFRRVLGRASNDG